MSNLNSIENNYVFEGYTDWIAYNDWSLGKPIICIHMLIVICYKYPLHVEMMEALGFILHTKHLVYFEWNPLLNAHEKELSSYTANKTKNMGFLA